MDDRTPDTSLLYPKIPVEFIYDELVQAPGSPSHLDPVETDQLLRKYKIDTLITVYVLSCGEKTWLVRIEF